MMTRMTRMCVCIERIMLRSVLLRTKTYKLYCLLSLLKMLPSLALSNYFQKKHFISDLTFPERFQVIWSRLTANYCLKANLFNE